MWFDSDAVLRPQRMEIERSEQRYRRGATRLMAADLEPVATGPHVVGVVDHPGAEPKHLVLERMQHRKCVAGSGFVRRLSLGQGHGSRLSAASAGNHCEDAINPLLWDSSIAHWSMF